MSSAYLEIVKLNSGDIALRRSDDEGEALVTITFSEESKAMINDATMDVAKVMIQAGIHAAATIAGVEIQNEEILHPDEVIVENFGEEGFDDVLEALEFDANINEKRDDGFDEKEITKKVISRTLH